MLSALKAAKLQHPVRQLENGKVLIEFLKTNEIHKSVILLDLNMPVMNGFDALRKIKSSSEMNEHIVVVLTSSIKEEDARLCKRLGADEVFRKPMSLEGYKELAAHIITFAERALIV